jgi:S1-C subfamily serine protease
LRKDRGMANDSSLLAFSNGLADLAESAGRSVVQVQGRRRPGTGVVYGDDIVLTTVRSLGGEDGLHVRRPDGATLDAELAGWDPTTNLAVLRVNGLQLERLVPSTTTARPGHLVIALARSWSNALTVSAGVVSVIGGPFPTGRRRAIDQILRTTAPMHDGFSGGALIDPSGGLAGVTTAARIRGLGVVIPAAIAWTTAATLIEHGQVKRGYLGVSAQPVRVPATEGRTDERRGLLVVGVSDGSPAAGAGVIVGDVLLEFDSHPLTSPEDLLDLLVGDRVGREATLKTLRGGRPQDVAIVVGERPDARG